MAARWAVGAGKFEGTERSGGFEVLACLVLAYSAASLQVVPGCAASLAGRGRRGESGFAWAWRRGAPGSGTRAASLGEAPGLQTLRVACLGPLALPRGCGEPVAPCLCLSHVLGDWGMMEASLFLS